MNQVQINFSAHTYTFSFQSQEWADWFWREYQTNIRKYKGGTMAFIRCYTEDLTDEYAITKVEKFNTRTKKTLLMYPLDKPTTPQP